MCPDATVFVSLYYDMCSHTTISVSSHTTMCHHTTIYVSSFYYMCPHTAILVLILLDESSYYYIYVRILIYICGVAGASNTPLIVPPTAPVPPRIVPPSGKVGSALSAKNVKTQRIVPPNPYVSLLLTTPPFFCKKKPPPNIEIFRGGFLKAYDFKNKRLISCILRNQTS